jgi:pyridoxamine--pyruvate transaminase
VWARHALAARACRAGLKAMKLPIWPASEAIAAPTTTAVRVPAGINDLDILAAARAMYGLVFSRGRGETLGKLLRIGHMGPVAEPGYVIVALAALGGALRHLGHAVDVGAGVEAAMAEVAKSTAH